MKIANSFIHGGIFGHPYYHFTLLSLCTSLAPPTLMSSCCTVFFIKSYILFLLFTLLSSPDFTSFPLHDQIVFNNMYLGLYKHYRKTVKWVGPSVYKFQNVTSLSV